MADPPSFAKRAAAFAYDQHLPLGLLVFSVLGFLIPAPGRWLSANTPLSTASLIGIFFLSGLGLKTDEMRAAFAPSSAPALLFGFASILASVEGIDRTGGVLRLPQHRFFPRDPEPGEIAENRVDGFLRGTGFVGVLDAQEEFAPGLFTVAPVEQCGAGAADMQHACG